MDCPILCDGSDRSTVCPDADCGLYDSESNTCALASLMTQAQACLESPVSELGNGARQALERLQAALRSGPAEVEDGSARNDSKLAFLVSEAEERRRAQERMLQVLDRSEAADESLRGEVRTVGDRLGVLEASLGTLEERLSGLARATGSLQTDQFRVAERLGGDLSRQIEGLATRLEEGEATTRRVLEDLATRTDDLTKQGKSLAREVNAGSVRQEEQTKALSRVQDDSTEKLSEIHRDAGTLQERLDRIGSRMEEGTTTGHKLQEELLGKSIEISSQLRNLIDQVDAVSARQQTGAEEAELQNSAVERRHQEGIQELEAAAAERHKQLEVHLAEMETRLDEPLEGTRAALESWRSEATGVLEALRQQHKEGQHAAQRAHDEEARELSARGVLLFHQGSLEAAEVSFRRAVELRPDFAEAHNNLGLVQSRQGDDDAAVVSFEKAMACGEELPAALNNLGFLYHTQMRDAEAVEMFQKALEADPGMALAFVNLGNAYHRQGHHAQALEAWRRALEIDPVNEDAERALRSFDLKAETARN